jgi:hypothetical protein
MATYKLIETQTVTTAVGSVTFSSIPQTFTDLKIVCSVRSSATAANTGNYDPQGIQFNSNTSNYSYKGIYGTGSSAISGSDTTMTASTGATVGRIQETGINNNNSTASVYSSVEIYVPNYAGSTAKSFSVAYAQEQNQTANNVGLQAQLWNDTAAITSIGLFLNGGNYMTYSSFSLYGIENQ